jgi:UDP-N-acetylglucosamine 1-carboxyvinyltransferase
MKRTVPEATPAAAASESSAPPSMDALVINGGKKLSGTIAVSGAKNAALPVMAATLLTPGRHTLRNVPNLWDTRTMARVLEQLGAKVEFNDHVCTIDTTAVDSVEAPYDLVRTMRASIYVLGPLLARFGHARVSLPGGCAWGPRPVNLHIEGMKALGANIEIEHGYIVARNARLRGATIHHEVVSVGATGNLLMAAVLADGETVIDNAAVEPDITALAEILVDSGAHIDGIGTRRLVIEGVDELKPLRASIIPDRIEGATFMAAAAITGGEVTLTHCDADHMTAAIQKLRECGAEIDTGDGEVRVRGPRRAAAAHVTTAPYPGFPTDMQAQMMAVLAVADGTSVVTDTIYLDRFTHVPELVRLGADIKLDHNVAVITGVERLQGAPVMATDIRASAALVLAALVAEGETRISRIYHLDRGYEALDEKLAQAGASIQRVKE